MLFKRADLVRFRQKYPAVDNAIKSCFSGADSTYNRAEWGTNAGGQPFASYEAGFCGEGDSVYQRSFEQRNGVCFDQKRAVSRVSEYQLFGVAKSVAFNYNPYDRIRAYNYPSPEYCEIYPGIDQCYLALLEEMLWYGSFGEMPDLFCRTDYAVFEPPDLPEDHFELLEKKIVAVGKEIKDAIQVPSQSSALINHHISIAVLRYMYFSSALDA
jgi:hypothetical protein